MVAANHPSRGEVWEVDFGAGRGREQRGRRPGLVISSTVFNRGPADLLVVVPMTSRDKGVPLHVQIEPPEGGVRRRSFVKPEDVRSISLERLGRRFGSVLPETLATVESRLRVLLEL